MDQEKATAPLHRPRRRWLRTTLLALAIFISGILVGGGITFKVISHVYKRSFQEPEATAERITQRMKRRLALTDEQVIQVRRILLERMRAFQALRREFRPQLEAQIEVTRREMRAVLLPEQVDRWEKDFDRVLKFWLPPPPGDPLKDRPDGEKK